MQFRNGVLVHSSSTKLLFSLFDKLAHDKTVEDATDHSKDDGQNACLKEGFASSGMVDPVTSDLAAHRSTCRNEKHELEIGKKHKYSRMTS